MNEKLYSKITDALVGDGYIVIQNALDEELGSSLLNFAKNEKDFKRAGISGKGDLHLDSSRRRDKIHWLQADNSTQSQFLEFADGL
ncbi:MAG: 2OG-Fe(II) oxygenase, partial [Epsilonproteobacteria bacterium]